MTPTPARYVYFLRSRSDEPLVWLGVLHVEGSIVVVVMVKLLVLGSLWVLEVD